MSCFTITDLEAFGVALKANQPTAVTARTNQAQHLDQIKQGLDENGSKSYILLKDSHELLLGAISHLPEESNVLVAGYLFVNHNGEIFSISNQHPKYTTDFENIAVVLQKLKELNLPLASNLQVLRNHPPKAFDLSQQALSDILTGNVYEPREKAHLEDEWRPKSPGAFGIFGGPHATHEEDLVSSFTYDQ